MTPSRKEIDEAIKVLELHKQIDEAWYPMSVVKWKWSKGRMKYREDVLSSVKTALNALRTMHHFSIKEQQGNQTGKSVLDKFQEFKQESLHEKE